MFQVPGGSIGGLHSVEILHAVVVAFRNHTFGIQVKAYERHFFPVVFFDYIRLEILLYICGRKVVVGGKPLGVAERKIVLQGIHPVVEIMVAENGEIVSEFVHHLHLHLPSIEGKEECTLNGIAGINQQNIRMHRPDTVN